MEQSLRMSSGSLVKKFYYLLWKPNVHCCDHNSPLPVPILNQNNTVHTSPTYFLTNHFNIIFPPTPKSTKHSLHFRLSDHSFVRTSHNSHGFIILITFSDEYKIWRYSLRSFLQLPDTKFHNHENQTKLLVLTFFRHQAGKIFWTAWYVVWIRFVCGHITSSTTLSSSGLRMKKFPLSSGAVSMGVIELIMQ
jgi:hypothetical protein